MGGSQKKVILDSYRRVNSNLPMAILGMARIYLASPYGFATSTVGFLQELKSDLRKDGHQVIDPWEAGERLLKSFMKREGGLSIQARARELAKMNHDMAEGNRNAIKSVKFVVAALDGPDVDSGTASEIGYAFAHGKTIFGYRGDFRRTGENEAAIVNAQVQYWIEESGGRKGRILRSVPEVIKALRTAGAVQGGRSKSVNQLA